MISVLIATYGAESWAELAWSRAYPSALGQTDDIVVYHGTTLAQARNQAAELAKGDWLCFLDADDELCSGYLEAIENAIGYRDNVLLVPALQRIEAGRQSRPAIPNKGKWPAVSECVIGTVVPRRLFLEAGGFREEADDGTPLTLYEDWDLFLRMWDAGARLVYVPEAVYCAHGGGRNNGGDWKPVYDAIWGDHLERWSG